MTTNHAYEDQPYEVDAGPDADVIPLTGHETGSGPAPDRSEDRPADRVTDSTPGAADGPPTAAADETADGPAVVGDRHYEVILDEDADPYGAVAPVPVDAPPERGAHRNPVIPPALRGRANAQAAARSALSQLGYRVAYHAVRLPRYAVLGAFWSVVGGFRLAGRQLSWWWVTEQYGLRQHAADHNDPEIWIKLHHDAMRTRLWRGIVLAGEAVALLIAALVLLGSPWWCMAVTAAVVLPWLAHLGRPVDRRIVTPAVVTPRFRRLNADIVLRAYYAAKLGNPDKPDERVTFGSTMQRDGEGSRVLVDLPYGKGLGDAVKAREAIASGLDVSLAQVFISRDPSSHRRHVLWVADRDPLAIPAGRTPLLACKPTDIWKPAPFGLDERGAKVSVDLMWNSLLVGAQPRQGKTFSARALALYAALDPYVKMSVFDGKGSPDWRKFALVADSFGFGLTMMREGDPIEILIDSLRELKSDVQERYQRLSELPVDVCPEGKLTREIARDPKYGMPVRMIVLDEFQEYFDLPDANATKEIASLLVFLVKVAPAAGVIALDATQKPSGIGTGQIAEQFKAFRDNHQIRFALRTGSWQVSDLVLGAGANTEGYDSSTLLPDYKGVGLLRGASDATPTVRTFFADAGDAEKILNAARAFREGAGTLTGMAAGEQAAREARDVLTDVRSTYQAGETFVPWQQIAARLAEVFPEHYSDVTADAISAQLRALGVPSVNGKRGGQVRKGAKADAIATAIERRAAG